MGQIDVETILRSVPEPLTQAYYLANPPETIEAITGDLAQRGLPPGQVIAETWE